MKKTIHYALILDQNGSMHHLKEEVISSFNEQVEMIRKIEMNEPEVEIKVTLCIFNDTVEFKYLTQSTKQLKKLKPIDYQPNSCTALYDAIGVTMLKMSAIKSPDDKIFLAVFTDGLENASTDYTANDIRYKIKKEEKEGWQIQFFCRYEDETHYKKKLDLSDDISFCISNISQKCY